MSQPDFYAVLDECLARQRQGEGLEACLADYPEQATELNLVLPVSADLYQLSRLEPAPDMVARGYEAMMAAVTAQERPSWRSAIPLPAVKLWSSLKPQKSGGLSFIARLVVILLAIMILSSVFAITASAGSLPGDVLYPLKRSWENTRLALTLSEPSRQALEIEFAEQRREEVQAVLELRRPVIVEFQGRLLSSSDGVWLVDGLTVVAGDDTEIAGAISVGQQVVIRAQVELDGRLVALRIAAGEADPSDTTVPIEESPPTRTPRPTPESTITREANDKPTGEATRQPTATVTPSRNTEPTEPTLSATSSEPTREATATRQATATITPSRDNEPTRSSEPTRPAEPTPTGRPDSNVAPSDKSTATPVDRPTETLSTSPTGTAKANDEPTRDPEPTATHEPRPSPTKNSDAGGNSDRPKNS